MSQFIDIQPPAPLEKSYPPFDGKCPRSIIILGVSGSGKTEVGRYLAEYLSLEFVDADDKVEERLGMPLASAVISNFGDYEDAHREVTRQILASCASSSPAIYALAPSPSVTDEALTSLKDCAQEGCLVVELSADISEVSRRMGLNAPRSVALGAPRAMLTKMIAATHQAHASVSNVNVNTVGRSIADIGQEIVAAL